MKRHVIAKISPNPSLQKRGNSSLCKREGRRDLAFEVRTIMHTGPSSVLITGLVITWIFVLCH